MGFVQLELPCPKSSSVVKSSDPEPHWTWGELLSELNSLEAMLGASPSPLKQSDSPDFPQGNKMGGRCSKPFVISIPDGDVNDLESDDDEEGRGRRLTSGTRFSCNDLDLDFSDSEESDDELHLKTIPSDLMGKKSVEEGILFEFESVHQLKVKEQVRNKLSALEAYQLSESERQSSTMSQLEKRTEEWREMDRMQDMKYQRVIAEMLNDHLYAVQRDYKQRFQIEEQRIRDDLALEEAKKEKALQEEKNRQEKAKAEEKAKLREAKEAEEVKRAAMEAARKESIEAAEKEAARIKESDAAQAASKEAAEQKRAADRETLGEMKEGNLIPKDKDMQLTGICVMAADAALKAEANRLKAYDEVAEKYYVIAQEFEKYARKIRICADQINGEFENINARASILLDIINNPQCPQSILILLVAKKVVFLCSNTTGNIDNIAFGRAYVILLLTSKVPAVMDFVLAELHKACIYTVPKYIQPPQRASNAQNYRKMIGYREEDGKLESLESYLSRVRSYMKLYAALIQTEIQGLENPHGLKQGWAWLAWFLNKLPANRSTATALESFLMIAGFALYRRYGRQFVKLLNVISLRFLPALRGHDPRMAEVQKLEKYLNDKMYTVEPEGSLFRGSLLSKELV